MNPHRSLPVKRPPSKRPQGHAQRSKQTYDDLNVHKTPIWHTQDAGVRFRHGMRRSADYGSPEHLEIRRRRARANVVSCSTSRRIFVDSIQQLRRFRRWRANASVHFMLRLVSFGGVQRPKVGPMCRIQDDVVAPPMVEGTTIGR